MKMKIQLKNIFGSLIFELEKEKNSISETVKEYIKKEIGSGKVSADLRFADLRFADLRFADLRFADLRSADLRFADLHSADLSSADLSSADLSYANLSSADLSSANLSYANLSYANLSLADLRSAKNKNECTLPIYCKWNYGIIGNKIQIGCKEKTIEEWDKWFKSKKTYYTDRNTDEFKQIEAIYLACKAYYKHLNK